MLGKKYRKKIKYEDPVEFSIEIALEKIESLLKSDYTLSKRAMGLLLLQEDEWIEHRVREKEEEKNFNQIKNIVQETKTHSPYPLDYIIAIRRQQEVCEVLKNVTEPTKTERSSFGERLSRIAMNPITGLPILFLVLYWGLYKIVGGFGAGVLVDYLEGTVFVEYINPFVTKFFTFILPWHVIQDLFVGEYGVITLGARYAIAIILPIVTLFFIVFSVIEDSGYLPRLAMLIDRIFKKIGLSGRAVIPMVLGFGCATMATMATRTLPTKRERIISTLLLALAVPCSAQLGLIFALLEGNQLAMLIWVGVLSLVFLFIGYLTAKIFPGERPTFYMEVPPLRLPKLSNIFVKTYTRVQWYLKEILPVFVLASFLIWIGQISHAFNFLMNLLKVPMQWIGLPPEGAEVFLFGFFRRDYGAAGLYDLNKSGILSGVQLVVACIALTLFLPCIAQLLINIKERGLMTGIGISIFVLFFSFSIAFIVNCLLVMTGVTL
jgi:ferrous iron transport protein B